MPSCIRLGQAETLLTCTLLLFISACTPTPTQAQIKPVSLVPEVRINHQSQAQAQNPSLALDTAYQILQTKIAEDGSDVPSSLSEFYRTLDQLGLEQSSFFKQQNSALGLIETYWELVIIDVALQKIWLEQAKLTLTQGVNGVDQNTTALKAHLHLSWLKTLATSSKSLQQQRTKISQNLARIIGSKPTHLNLSYLPLSELRLRLPEPKDLLINEFSQGLLEQHHAATYAQLRSDHTQLNILKVNRLYQQPILGSYVWHDIETSLKHQAGLLTSNTSNPKLARQLRLTQLNIALINYHYSHQQLQSIRGQYETAESLYQLSQEQLLSGNVNQLEDYSLGLEAMAINLLYLQATLDSIHAYARLLASSHLSPDQWQQSLTSLSLSNKDDSTISKVTDIAPASGKPIVNSEDLVVVIDDDKKDAQQRRTIDGLAFSQYLKPTSASATIVTTALAYLWQVEIGSQANITSTQAMFTQAPELTYLARYPTLEVGTHSKRPNLTAVGLGHSQAKALCRRLKRLKVECWMRQSHY